MTSITEVADKFFEACETGKGWNVCKEYCTPDATFSAQSEALAEIGDVRGYTEWMKEGEIVARMLYDHQEDPDENINVVDLPEHEDVVAEMSGMVREVRKVR